MPKSSPLCKTLEWNLGLEIETEIEIEIEIGNENWECEKCEKELNWKAY